MYVFKCIWGFCLEDGADFFFPETSFSNHQYTVQLYWTRRAQFSFQTNNNFTLKLRWHQQMRNCTFHINFLFLNCYMFRHCRHLQWSYTKISLKHTRINTKRFICIITKEFYRPIKNVAHILEDWMQFQSPLDISVHATAVTDSYTAFSHTGKQIGLSLYWPLYIILHIFHKCNHNLNYWLHNKCMFIINYLLLYVSIELWCKISEDGDNAETCSS